MRNSLSTLLYILFFLLFFSACGDSESVTDSFKENINIEIESSDGLLLEDHDISNSEIKNIMQKLGGSIAGDVESLSSNCQEECQSCDGIGGYSQIGFGLPGELVFHAYTMPNTSNPHCPCYGDIAGTVTFEFEVTDYHTGQPIGSGSVPRSFGGDNYSGHCNAYGFPAIPYSNELRTSSFSGMDVWVELKTIHKIGNEDHQIHEHETSGRFAL